MQERVDYNIPTTNIQTTYGKTKNFFKFDFLRSKTSKN